MDYCEAMIDYHNIVARKQSLKQIIHKGFYQSIVELIKVILNGLSLKIHLKMFFHRAKNLI